MKIKFLCLIVALVMLLQLNVFALEQHEPMVLPTVSRVNRNEIKKEGDFCTYVDDKYSIAVQIISDRSTVISAYNKQNNTLKEYVGDYIITKDLVDLFNKVIDDQLEWTNYYEIPQTITYRNGRNDEVINELERKYGSEYFNKIIFRKPFDNNICEVYEDQTFETYLDTSKYFKAGTSLATIVALFSLPLGVIKSVLTVVKTAYDVYIIAKDTFIEKYVANVNNWREARIDHRNYISAGKTIYGSCIWTDEGGIEYHNEKVIGGNSRFEDFEKMADDSIYQYQTGH
ncbi:MAG: hypothetical protein SOZ22_01930 [Ezakiella sp.]|nr:hypothetical protein [Ezakiella sp.]